MTHDDLYLPGVCLRQPASPSTARPRRDSWWTVAESGAAFRRAAAKALAQIKADPRGAKLPDRDGYARGR